MRLRNSLLLLLIGLVTSFMFNNCNNSKSSNQQVRPANIDPKTLGEFKFSRKFYDFGVIKDGDTVRHTFVFKNVGIAPLIIHDISVSCGCTVVSFSKIPIKPHEEGFVNVQFTKHHDPGRHSKLIIIKANTENIYTVLTIYATINDGKVSK